MPIPVASCQLLRQPSLDPGVFVPAAAPSSSLARPHAVVLDLCCGSGTVGVTVRCARRTIAAHGQAYEGDLYDDPLPAALRGRVDMLVANAPQVPTEAIGMMPRRPACTRLGLRLMEGWTGLTCSGGWLLRDTVAGTRDTYWSRQANVRRRTPSKSSPTTGSSQG